MPPRPTRVERRAQPRPRRGPAHLDLRRLPEGVDPIWAEYWAGGPHDDSSPVVRTIQECLQAVMWNATTALAPVDQPLPTGLVVVLFRDRPPSHLVVARLRTARSPQVRSFVQLAVAGYR